jgi:hypothetical protein
MEWLGPEYGFYSGSGSSNKSSLGRRWCIGNFATVGQIPRSTKCYPSSIMEAKGLTPILNVSDIASTVAWFEKWGWKKLWDWGTPPTFGAVGSAKEACIFLCQGAQGGRGRDAQALRRRRAGGHIPAHRYAVERPRDAPSPSGWPLVPGRPRLRAPKIEVAALPRR